MKLKSFIAAFLTIATVFNLTACSGSETSSSTSENSSVTSEVSKDESSKEESSKEESKTETSATEAPESSEPETSATESSEPETSAPETTTSAPETTTTKAPETSAPETTTTKAPETEKPESTPTEGSEMTDTINTFKLSEDNAKHIGRTYTDSEGTVWLSHSASALEFTFTGTKASVTVCEDIVYGAESEPRFAVYVNEERADGKPFAL